jgi:hypothetical protein
MQNVKVKKESLEQYNDLSMKGRYLMQKWIFQAGDFSNSQLTFFY